MLDKLQFCVWSSTADVVRCKFHDNGVFPSASTHEILTPLRRHESAAWNRIWKQSGPQQYSSFLLQVQYKGIKSASLLHTRGILPPPKCGICGSVSKTVLHALRNCPDIVRIWRFLLP